MIAKPVIFRRAVKEDAPPRQTESKIDGDDSLRERIIGAIRCVHDPEISINIYDLGLIYSIDIDEQSRVAVDMTLTAPACPVAGSLPGQVEAMIKSVDGVVDAHVELVWEPPWSKDRMSDEARLELGLL